MIRQEGTLAFGNEAIKMKLEHQVAKIMHKIESRLGGQFYQAEFIIPKSFPVFELIVKI
jgi:hypothetical protein